MTGAVTVWIRRCSRCHTVDERGGWDDPAVAQTDTTQTEPRAHWYRRRGSQWQCQACGSHGFMVEPHDSPRRF